MFSVFLPYYLIIYMFILFIYYNIGCLGVCLYSINVQTIMILLGMDSLDFFEKI